MSFFSKSSPDPKIQVTEYRMSIHMGICTGPIGAIKRIMVGEKVAWTGSIRETTAIAINKPGLFGGEKKEGGVIGTVHALFGDAEQTMPSALASRLGRTTATCPGFRGLFSLFFIRGGGGFTWGWNSPYLKNVWVEVERLPGVTGMDWYPETAPIPRDGPLP